MSQYFQTPDATNRRGSKRPPSSAADRAKLDDAQKKMFVLTLRAVMVRRAVKDRFDGVKLSSLRPIKNRIVQFLDLDHDFPSSRIPNFGFPDDMADDPPQTEADTQLPTRFHWDRAFKAEHMEQGDGLDPGQRLKAYTDTRLSAIHYRLPFARYRDVGEIRPEEDYETMLEALPDTAQTAADICEAQRDAMERAAKDTDPFIKNEMAKHRRDFLGWIHQGDNWKSTKMIELVKVVSDVTGSELYDAGIYDPQCRGSIIVCCDFLGALDIAKIALSKSPGTGHLPIYEYNGTKGKDERTRIEEEFARHGIHDPAVMLMTSQCGAEGLNLTTATWVVFLAPCWNPHMELQCVFRAWRIGQRGLVSTVYLIANNSIETRMRELASIKRAKGKVLLEDFSKTMHELWKREVTFEWARQQVCT
jgi:hypothetical protein